MAGARSLGFAVAVTSVVASASALARPSLDADNLAELDRYVVLSFTDPWQAGIERGKAIGVIDATPEEVFRVATDYSKYKEFMPRVLASSVLWQSLDQALVELVADLPWPASNCTVAARYAVERKPGDIYKVRFDLVHGNMKRYLGSLYIEPFAPGKTAVTYELVAEPDTIAPKSAVNRGIRRSTGNFVHALRQRINELHRLGYLHPEPVAPRAGERSPLRGTMPAPAALNATR
jgi:ribosome-associated toxin RatA of RatAB toxin-antitoxin module